MCGTAGMWAPSLAYLLLIFIVLQRTTDVTAQASSSERQLCYNVRALRDTAAPLTPPLAYLSFVSYVFRCSIRMHVDP